MSLIVSDTTPISCMVRIGRADLLAALFPEVRIPSAVADELDRGAAILGDWRSVLLPCPCTPDSARRLGHAWANKKR